MVKVFSFTEALEETEKMQKSLLLGNGFSMAQGGGNFSYGNLLQRSGLDDDSPINRVFDALATVDFEEVMGSLQHAAVIQEAYGDQAQAEVLRNDAGQLREALIHAIRDVHPAIQYDIPTEQFKACGAFLTQFDKVFTLNYDLLLYWVILNLDRVVHRDGFGLGEEVGGFRSFREDAYCSLYYLHGALHLFLNNRLETRKRIANGSLILDSIEKAIRRTRSLPLFIAEGTSIEKKSKIYSIPYLRHCYEELMDTCGSIFIFGHSADENDAHIYDAVFDSNIETLVLCVHDPKKNLKSIRAKLAPYAANNEHLKIIYVDAATANVWGNSA